MRLRLPAIWRRARRRPGAAVVPVVPVPMPRDTDADWRKIGADEPFFGVLTHRRFLRDNLDDAAKAEFYRTGEVDIAGHLAALRHRFGAFEPRSALDFGCGVGRLTRPLAALTGDAVGVDVSEGMLAEARTDAGPGVTFQTELPDRAFDWVLSIIVFQHIEASRGYALIRAIARLLAPGGRLTLHVTVWRDPEHYGTAGVRFGMVDGFPALSATARDHPLGTMNMYDYDLSIVAAILFSAGVDELALVHTDHGGHHGVLLYGRKADAPPA